MRTIKFRAWVHAREKMYEVVSLDFGNPTTIIVRLFDRQAKDEQSWIRPQPTEAYPDSVLTLLQFTGLLDRHGKEIWEGDIVRIFDNREAIGSIGMLYGSWQIMRGELVGGQLGMFEAEDLEVIGNVYEQPRLLEVPS